MEFLQHLTEYYKGERLGAICFTVAGILFLLLAFAVWRVAAPGTITRGMLVPLLVIAVLGSVAGPLLWRSNMDRLVRLPQEYLADADALVTRESARMEGVERMWMPLKITWTVLLAAGLLLAFRGGTPTWKGVGLGILLIGTVGHIVDGIASERSRTYVERLAIERAAG
ncbi:MAG TPA: hypothetical protein P5027_12715 [Flavobacteriales bacterium]|nr:hypothetical protein [Flavobacteriales bacterium]HRW90806.1 hypothetical protein [Flavobacteriales bacterium]